MITEKTEQIEEVVLPETGNPTLQFINQDKLKHSIDLWNNLNIEDYKHLYKNPKIRTWELNKFGIFLSCGPGYLSVCSFLNAQEWAHQVSHSNCSLTEMEPLEITNVSILLFAAKEVKICVS